MGCNIDCRLKDQQGIEPITIFGHLSHQTNYMGIQPGSPARYARLHVYDREAAIDG
jgi:hypothetical protein